MATASALEAAVRLARGRTRRAAAAVQAEIDTITTPRWVREVLTTTLTGDSPTQLRLTFRTNQQARKRLEARIFGKRILFANRTEWTTAEIVAAYSR